ncbi:hypothetical protein NC652_004583 [Populus alba x Populus x berolinensis]|nr:hypothetical protein NC652_040700 [Populus alba x Populus x berolinensis]KAJ6858985.1 hypothetical protein NC652_041321 [Populus alba x Populus x berolinensis]KAJ6911427.1 hypothetical protein NC652_021901 [Populus alba x Populus x berolinensis]KAJ6911428.1 hypothetical protein NC652_021902 [Populus alba x Populus x berolinensis]KAJ6924037.1 hypothetical protein NC652_017372 [Populus alba x Populus x berolinensis]
MVGDWSEGWRPVLWPFEEKLMAEREGKIGVLEKERGRWVDVVVAPIRSVLAATEREPKGQLVKGEEDENNEKEGLSWLRGRRVAGREANSWGAAAVLGEKNPNRVEEAVRGSGSEK